MSIEQTNVVDFISTDPETKTVVLSTSDHLEWNLENIYLLQENINSYIAFIESGEIYQSYPAAKARDLKIHIYCQYYPSDTGYEFLLKASEVAKSAGITLTYGPAKTGYIGSAD